MSAEAANAEPTGSGPAEIVSGYLSALAIFASLIALAWHPLRLMPVCDRARARRLRDGPAATAGSRSPPSMITGICFFLGMTIAVVTQRPLW